MSFKPQQENSAIENCIFSTYSFTHLFAGQPSLKKAEELKLKKEAAELNVENILTTETGIFTILRPRSIILFFFLPSSFCLSVCLPKLNPFPNDTCFTLPN